MNDRERITRLEIRCEQLQLTVNEAFHWIDILKSDLSDLQDRVGQADRKTENSSEKPNNCEECEYWSDTEDGCADRYGCRTTTEDCSTVPTSSKMEQVDEPITQTKTQNSNLSFEKADERCKGCGHYKLTCDLFSEICKYEPKDEPQTCSVNGRPYDCGNCEYFKCTADEPQTELKGSKRLLKGKTEETEMERLERIDNELEDAWARIRELTDCPWR